MRATSGLHFDEELTFKHHINEKINKSNKGTGIIRKNESFSSKIESVQYNASLPITRAVRGTSQEKLYQALGLESLKSRRWLRRICYFYKLIKTQKPL